MDVIRSFKQGWWAPLAVLVGAWDVLLGAGIIVDQQNPGSLVGGMLHIVAGVGVFAGLKMRSDGGVKAGTALIGFGALVASMLFWLVVPPVVALAVLIGAVTSATTEAHSPSRVTTPS